MIPRDKDSFELDLEEVVDEADTAGRDPCNEDSRARWQVEDGLRDVVVTSDDL